MAEKTSQTNTDEGSEAEGTAKEEGTVENGTEAEAGTNADTNTETEGDAEGKGKDKDDAEGKDEGEGKGKGESEGEAEDDDGTKDTGAPEAYETFAVPEGIDINPETMSSFQEIAKELDLSQSQAQRLVDLQSGNVGQLAQTFADMQVQKANDIRADWEAQTKADPDMGGDKLDETLARSNKAVQAFAKDADEAKEFNAFLKETGLGSHPVLIRVLSGIGQYVAEDGTLVSGSGNRHPSDKAGQMYPSMKQQA